MESGQIARADCYLIGCFAFAKVKDAFFAELEGSEGAQKDHNKGSMNNQQSPSALFDILVFDKNGYKINH